MNTRVLRLLAVLVTFGLLAAACGSDDAPTETSESASADTDTADAEAEAEPEPEPEPEPTEVPEPDPTPVPEPTEEPEPEPEPVVLTIWADERRVEPLEAVAPAFTEATGVEVAIELVEFGEIRDQVTTAGPAGEGPDIFVGAHDWTGELAANGVIDSIDVSSMSDDFVQAALNGFNFEGSNYAIPYATEAIAMYRNTDLAADAPASWDDVTAACDAAAVANCVVIPGGGAAGDAYHMYPFVSAFGGFIFPFDSTTGFDASVVGLDSEDSIAGAQFLATAVADGVISSTDYDTAKNLWLEGEAAYWITGPWELGGTREQTTVANWDVSIIPPFGDQPAQPFIGAQGFFLSAFSENGLIAQSFLSDFLATDDTMQALYEADPRGTAWKAVQASLASDPQVAAFDASAANGIPMPNIPEMGSVWGPLGDNMLLIRNGEIDPTEAMATAAEAVRAAVAG